MIATATATSFLPNGTTSTAILSPADLARAQYYRQNREVVTMQITAADGSTTTVDSPFLEIEVQQGIIFLSYKLNPKLVTCSIDIYTNIRSLFRPIPRAIFNSWSRSKSHLLSRHELHPF